MFHEFILAELFHCVSGTWGKLQWTVIFFMGVIKNIWWNFHSLTFHCQPFYYTILKFLYIKFTVLGTYLKYLHNTNIVSIKLCYTLCETSVRVRYFLNRQHDERKVLYVQWDFRYSDSGSDRTYTENILTL